MAKEIAIKITDLEKTYSKGNKKVLDGINLEVYKGEILGFIGRNGVGKSTTIKCMTGIINFDDGDIELLGHSIFDEPLEAKKVFGYVPDNYAVYEGMTGREYVDFIASVFEVDRPDYEDYFNQLAMRFQIANDVDRLISEYSHGMKQKICLIASLIHEPDIWILDEPLTGLDIMVAHELINAMKEYKEKGKTVFLTSHNIDVVEKICDRVAIVLNGKVERIIEMDKVDPNTSLEELFFTITSGGAKC